MEVLVVAVGCESQSSELAGGGVGGAGVGWGRVVSDDDGQENVPKENVYGEMAVECKY